MRLELPTGTVTFVFTDIEGSTLLLAELGDDRYAALLAEHHRVCREAWVAYDGVEVDTAGDAFFVAFASPTAAISAASQARVALAALRLSVRMGVHTGEVTVAETGYVGLEVHRAARIAAAGHGGQVLVSATTAALVGHSNSLLQALPLVDLGNHRFKDLAAPERVFQLGDEVFQPLKSLYHSNLPVPATAFLGRERELGAVVELLGRDDVRLVTLTGPGGTGKTRLALQAAAETSERFTDGVFWVALAPLSDPSLMLAAVAQAVEVEERPDRGLMETLREWLGGKRVLVLLDNAEHLMPDLAGIVADLVGIGGPTVLVTSRERLQVAAEQVYPVPELDAADGVELFLARAAAAGVALQPTGALEVLCARLEQLPLALELAASRTTVFSPEQLLERLAQRLDLLKGGRDADPRQQTLRATIDWSYELLDPDEQRVLRALSIFAAGCTYEAAEQVAGADPDTLQSLLDKSLLRRRDTDRGPRYWMLETIREYAAGRLQGNERAVVSEWHTAHVVSLVEMAWVGLRSESRGAWLDQLESESADIRLMFARLIDSERAVEALGLVSTLYRYWLSRNHLEEGRRLVSDLLPRFADISSVDVYRALQVLGDIARHQGDLVLAESCAARMLMIARSEGDGSLEANALAALATVLTSSGDFSRAASLCEKGLDIAERVNDPREIERALGNLTYCLLGLGEYARARIMAERVLEIGMGVDLIDLLNLSQALLGLDDIDAAAVPAGRALELAWEQSDFLQVSHVVDVAAAIGAARGDIDRAVVLSAAAEAARLEARVACEPVEAQLADRTRRATISAISQERFHVLERAGKALDIEEAVSRASAVLGGNPWPPDP